MIFSLPKDIERFKFEVDIALGEQGIYELKKKREKRTLKQNSYLHVLIALFAIEIGLTLNESKTDLKRYCSFMWYEKKEVKYLKESSKLNTKELSDWITWIRNYAANNCIYLPSADEYGRNWVEFEKQIEAHKKYL